MHLQTHTIGWLGLVLWPCALNAATNDLQKIAIAANGDGFILSVSGERFIPWGHNYASVDVMERLANEPTRVEWEFQDMKAAGTTVVRLHPEMPRFFVGPNQINHAELQQLRKLLSVAEKAGIRLMITGLACYQMNDRMPWYDALQEQERWRTQALFWQSIASVCVDSPAVFAYDLTNEPAATGKLEDGWYAGRMGDVEFCQRLTLEADGRSGEDIFRQWTQCMVSAIRQHDREHFITLGMLPFPDAYKGAAEPLDFVSPHLYPKSGKVDEEIELLKRFSWSKPIVIGETFPLTCSAEDEKAFLLKSRGISHGWLGHWPDKSPSQLRKLKRSNQATIQDAIWLSWVELFQDVGAQMKGMP